MRIQCIAFVPAAALVTGGLSLLTVSLVGALESRFAPEPGTPLVQLVRYESECESLERRLDEVSRAAIACEARPECLSSPIQCPVELQGKLADEYELLRSAIEATCEGRVTRVGCSWGDPSCSGAQCAVPEGWTQEMVSPATPRTFLF